VHVPCTVVLLGKWNWWPSKLGIDDAGPDEVGATADALGLATPDKPGSPTDTESRRNS
jgi:uncharacterized membrane protein YdfJ with MMPL/SSD domain